MGSKKSQNRLLRWFSKWAGSLRTAVFSPEYGRIVRTVEIVEQHERTLLIVPLNGAAPDACPLCGCPLHSGSAQQTQPQIPEPSNEES